MNKMEEVIVVFGSNLAGAFAMETQIKQFMADNVQSTIQVKVESDCSLIRETLTEENYHIKGAVLLFQMRDYTFGNRFISVFADDTIPTSVRVECKKRNIPLLEYKKEIFQQDIPSILEDLKVFIS